MSFPTSPIAGQTAVFNGITYSYTTSTNTWDRVQSVVTATSQLTVSGTITGGSIRTTSTSTPPSNPTVGDIWYNTTNDVILRYTSDGVTSVWLDITGPVVGNAVNGTNVTASLIPTNNITYDLGSPTNRFRTLYVSSSTIDLGGVPISAAGGSLQVNGATFTVMPKVTAIYPSDSSYTTSTTLAVTNNTSGYAVISGTGFVSGASVYVNTVSAITATVVSSTAINVQVPALSTGTYVVYVSNPDGSSTYRLPGLQYSMAPVWTATTSSISLAPTNGSYKFTAVSDSPVTYSITSGTLFSGFTLNTSTGLISGSSTYTTTSVTIQVTATDQEQQTVSQTATVSLLSNYTINYLFVAGGGGGGQNRGGGAGAGGLLTGTTATVIGTTYSITVGAGGSISGGTGSTGSNSSASFAVSVVALGGGRGGDYSGASTAGNGGSGGGAGYSSGAEPIGYGTPGQGYNGGAFAPSADQGAGGGGGAGGAGGAGCGTTGGKGGTGTYISITGSAVAYAGGGGGGTRFGTAGAGGTGGGGQGGCTAGTAGTAFTGGGGGGGGVGGPSQSGPHCGGAGGSGVVILSYQSSSQRGSGGTVTTYNPGGGTYYVHTFTATGSYTA